MTITTRPPEKTPRVSTSAALAERATRPDDTRAGATRWYRRIGWVAWVALIAALVLFDVYMYQIQLTPQIQNYQPNWYGARWISATDGSPSVGYFRKSFALDALPTGAFITLQADQSFYLYVNGNGIDQTEDDFYGGIVNRAYTYDITPYLTKGANVVAVKVNQHDDGIAGLRAVVGLRYGEHLQQLVTDDGWAATGDSALIASTQSLDRTGWLISTFVDTSWPAARYFAGTPPADGVLQTNPVVMETPLPTNWITAGTGSVAYFRTTLTLPQSRDTWLSFATTGQAEVYVNGHQLISQPEFIHYDASGLYTTPSVDLTAGMYKVTPFFSSGTNDVAIHVISAGNQPAAITFDLFVTTTSGAVQQYIADPSWQATQTASASWLTDDVTALWSQPFQVNVSAIGSTAPLKRLPQALASPDIGVSALNLSLNSLLLLAVMALAYFALGGRRKLATAGSMLAVERVGLVFAPGVMLLAGLWMVSREPLLPQPFPFASGLLWLAVGVTLATFVAVWWGTRRFAGRVVAEAEATVAAASNARRARVDAMEDEATDAVDNARNQRRKRVIIGLCVGALTLIGFYMVRYNLGYEPYWQDELASLIAAKGILNTGAPRFVGGYLYPKAELFSYMLAFVMKFFGDNPADTRMIAVIEYTISIPATYFVAKYFKGRRVALLATALMVFSALTLRWGQEARMYQQAELCLLIFVYLFYRALKPGERIRYIYFSMAAVLVMYFSHEETFIVLPAVLGYFLWTEIAYLYSARAQWASDRGGWRGWWLKRRHWLFAGLPAILVIATQYYITKHTGFPIVGTDGTTQPLLSYSTDAIVFYWRLLTDTQGLKLHYGGYELEFLTILALIAAIRGLVSNDRALRYLSLFVFLALFMLTFVFSLEADRYFYPLFPEFAILAASTVVWLASHVGTLARKGLTLRSARVVSAAFAVLFVVAVLWSQTYSISQFGVAVSRTFDLPYRHGYPQYNVAGAYIQAHMQPGDIVIASAPAGDVLFYAGRADYYLYRGKALYVYESDGHALDTDTAAKVILNASELDNVLSAHPRVWIFAAQSYEITGLTDEYPSLDQFVLVYEADDALVYLKSS